MTTSTPENSHAIAFTSYTIVGTIRLRRPTTEVGKLTADGAVTEPSAVKNSSQTTDNEEYPFPTRTENMEAITKNIRRNRKGKIKETIKIPGTSYSVEDASLAPQESSNDKYPVSVVEATAGVPKVDGVVRNGKDPRGSVAVDYDLLASAR